MPTPLVGAREMPDFSIMGMLLGGSSYASQWYSQRDQLRLLDQEEQRRGAAAAGFVKTPEFNVWMDNPADRRAGFNAWARTQGSPIAEQGARWLDESLSRIGNQDTVRLQASLQADNIKLDAQQKLWVEQRKAEMEQARFAETLKMTERMMAPGQQQQDALYDITAQRFGWKERPQDQSVVVDNNGQMAGFVPNPNNPKYQDMMVDVTNAKEFSSSITEMSELMDAAQSQGRGLNVKEAARFQALTGLSMMGVKEMYTAGALDQGLLDFMSNIIKPYGSWTGFGSVGSGNWVSAREKLKVLQGKAQRNIVEKGFKWSVPIEKMPDAGYYKPGDNIKKKFDPTVKSPLIGAPQSAPGAVGNPEFERGGPLPAYPAVQERPIPPELQRQYDELRNR